MRDQLQKAENFSPLWWDDFLCTTEQQTKPAVLKNCFGKELIAQYHESVANIVRMLCEMRTTRFGFRIFQAGRQLDDADMQRVYDTPPLPGESLQTWSHRVFGATPYGIILNTGEKFDEELSSSIAVALAPLFERVGYPREGVNFSIFIGNYDRTPLGIHQDSRGEAVIHFHLGPAKKTMYVWPKDEYQPLLERLGLTRADTAQLIPHAQHFEFGPGDLYFMPEGEYHIGEQAGFSVGLTVWQYNHTNGRLIQTLHKRLQRSMKTANEMVIEGDPFELGNASASKRALDSIELPPGLDDMSYRDLLREMHIDMQYAMRSNAGYRAHSIERKDSVTLNDGDMLEMIRPYRILIRRSPERESMTVYVRGHKVEMRLLDAVEEALVGLQEVGRMTVGEFADLLPADWDRVVGHYLVSQLYRYRAVDIIRVESEPAAA